MNPKAVEKALSLVGQGYIYGAKGQTCSPAFRQQQAEQYPDQAHFILEVGKKWDGVPVWDCAQLTRAVAKACGVALVSGATSQWNKTEWQEKGTIDSIPAGETVFVYRQKAGTSTMQHTGVALGDGTCVHARGTEYGVVRQDMNEYAWTHWARPYWVEEIVHDAFEPLYQAIVTAKSGKTVNMRAEPSGKVLEAVPLGEAVDVLAEADDWLKILRNGTVGYMQSAFLKRNDEMVNITISRAAAEELYNALAGVIG